MNLPSAQRLCALAAVASAIVANAAPASAVTPPQVDPSAAPPPGSAGPLQPMIQRGPCVTSGVLPGSELAAADPARALDLPEAWKYGMGEGRTVAVIDTGVRPGDRLPDVVAGGDFVQSTDGLTDCDGHGTLVAGLIAGRPGDDGFSGVAPEARILAIRQNSARFAPRNPGEDPEPTRAALDVETLARAIVRAADLGADVINVSVVICVPADRPVDQAQLGAAVKYAVEQRDAVIVAAAGNNRADAVTGSACASNALTDPGTPGDPRNWAGVTSVSTPSWWQPYVLSVGSVGSEGQPSPFTMAGPWVGIAAPGEQIVSVSNAPAGGLVNALPDGGRNWQPLSGTSYAAAYVSGVAALVRARFPQLTAGEVVHRLTATARGAARSPSNLVGAGTVDPVAALTWVLPADDPADNSATDRARPVDPPASAKSRDPTARAVAFGGTGALAALALAAVVYSAMRRGRTS